MASIRAKLTTAYAGALIGTMAVFAVALYANIALGLVAWQARQLRDSSYAARSNLRTLFGCGRRQEHDERWPIGYRSPLWEHDGITGIRAGQAG